MSLNAYDIVVVGAGSGGYAAARTARELGASVALVDHGPLGGLCILRGCMPSKTLIASGDVAQVVREAAALGVHAGPPGVDFGQVMARKARIIRGFADDRIAALETFALYRGQARFLSPNRLRVGDEVLEAKRFVVATGSIIAPPVVPGLDEAGYLDSDAALVLPRAPASLIVLGGGYVATELGQFYSRVGAQITMVLRASHVLSSEDDDVGDALTRYLREEGLRIETGALPVRAEGRGDRKVLYYAQDGAERSVEAEEILYALGRVPNVMGLDLEAAGVRYHPIAGIEVDAAMRTSNPDVYAVGDVVGGYLLVHVAIYQGEIAARNAVCQSGHEVDYGLVKTHAVFSDPQVAIVGETEKLLHHARVDYVTGKYPFDDHGKAISVGRTKGFVKMMAAREDGRILGAAVIGPDGSDLIHEMIVAMSYGATVYEFVKIPHLHPTLAEIWTYPAEDIIGQIASRGMAAAV